MGQQQLSHNPSLSHRSTWATLLYASFLLALSVLTGPQAQAQNAYYYGVNIGGGSANKGYIFRFTEDLDNFEIVHDFLGQAQGSTPGGSLLQASDGWLYGTTRYGGTNEKGVLYRFDPLNGDFESLHDFGTGLGSTPSGELLETADGKIYGVTAAGGVIIPSGGSGGVIYSYDIQDQVYEMRHSFLSPDVEFQGYSVEHGLTLGPDGKFYGAATNGGTFGHGTLFAFDPEDDSFNTLFHFDDSPNGRRPKCRLLLAADGKLYGTASVGGVGNRGLIFRLDPSTNDFSVMHSFSNAAASIGMGPQSYEFVETSPGVLYGTTSIGGDHNKGTLYRYNYISNSIDTLKSFGGGGPTGAYSLTVLPGGRLLGYCGSMNDFASYSRMYTYDLSLAGASAFDLIFDDIPLSTSLGLGFTRPILVDLTSLSVAEGAGTVAQWLPYPNPATQRVYLPDEGQVEVYNALGVCMYTGPVDAAGLDIAQWAQGLYFVKRLEALGKAQRTGRFVKE